MDKWSWMDPRNFFTCRVSDDQCEENYEGF